jgi:hypothetical protein
MMADDPKYLTVYHSDHDGEPLALIRADLPGNHATEIARALRMLGNGRIELVPTDSAAMTRSQDVADLFSAPAAPLAPDAAVPDPDEPGSNADPDAALRAEIRAQLNLDERRKRVEAEVRKEMAEDRKAERAKD